MYRFNMFRDIFRVSKTSYVPLELSRNIDSFAKDHSLTVGKYWSDIIIFPLNLISDYFTEGRILYLR